MGRGDDVGLYPAAQVALCGEVIDAHSQQYDRRCRRDLSPEAPAAEALFAPDGFVQAGQLPVAAGPLGGLEPFLVGFERLFLLGACFRVAQPVAERLLHFLRHLIPEECFDDLFYIVFAHNDSPVYQ